MTTSNPTTRQRKTPQQRAEEALGRAERRFLSLEKKLTQAKTAVHDLERDLEDARRRLTYAEQNPDLPHQPTTTSANDDQSTDDHGTETSSQEASAS